jgi:DNA-binding transcriptional ArsR family regulator
MADTDPAFDRVVTTDPDTAAVLGSPIRAAILDELAVGTATVDHLRGALDRRGYDLADTSVRHHVKRLHDAGMVAVARREDVNGGLRKHYRATTRAYAFDASEAAASIDAMRGLVRAELLSLCSRLAATHRGDFTDAAAALDPADPYRNGDRGAYVLRALLEQVLTDLERDGTLDERLPVN